MVFYFIHIYIKIYHFIINHININHINISVKYKIIFAPIGTQFYLIVLKFAQIFNGQYVYIYM